MWSCCDCDRGSMAHSSRGSLLLAVGRRDSTTGSVLLPIIFEFSLQTHYMSSSSRVMRKMGSSHRGSLRVYRGPRCTSNFEGLISKYPGMLEILVLAFLWNFSVVLVGWTFCGEVLVGNVFLWEGGYFISAFLLRFVVTCFDVRLSSIAYPHVPYTSPLLWYLSPLPSRFRTVRNVVQHSDVLLRSPPSL